MIFGLQIQRPATALGLIFIVVVLAYANSYGNGWHYDDVHSIAENPHIRSLQDPLGFFTDRTRFSRDPQMAMYRPLLVLSLATNYWWSELDTSSYLLVNLCIHVGCSMLLWVLLRQMGRGAALALVGAMLFGLHPLATEPVNYISARSESLCALFVLATLVAHVRAASHSWGLWRVVSAACFVAAMLSKETGITALGLIVAYDLTRSRFDWRAPLRALQPVHIVYVALAVAYLIVQSGHINVAVVDTPVRDRTTQMVTQIKALVYYARLLLVPHGLNVQHQFFEGGIATVVGSGLLALSSLGFVARKASADVRFGLGWCIIVLSPTLLVPLHILVNDHRLYLPLAGLLIAITSIWAGLWKVYSRPGRSSSAVTRLAVVGLLIFGILTQNRNPVWADEYSLWSDAAAKSPQPLVPVAYVHLGNYAKENGALSESSAYYRRALQIAPGHVAARNNLGLVLEAMGRVSAAADTFASLTRERPDLAEGWYNLGHALQAMAQQDDATRGHLSRAELLTQARKAYGQVADSSYHYDLALNNVGTTFEQFGRLDSAAVYYGRAHRLGRDSADPTNNLQRLSKQLGVHAGELLDANELIQLQTLCEELARIENPVPEALFYLSVSLFSQRRFEESLEPNKHLLERHPDFILGYLQLGNVLETLGRTAEAHSVYERQLGRQSEGPFADEAKRRLQVGTK